MWKNSFRLGGDVQKSQGEVMSAFGFRAHTPHWSRGPILVVIHPPFVLLHFWSQFSQASDKSVFSLNQLQSVLFLHQITE